MPDGETYVYGVHRPACLIVSLGPNFQRAEETVTAPPVIVSTGYVGTGYDRKRVATVTQHPEGDVSVICVGCPEQWNDAANTMDQGRNAQENHWEESPDHKPRAIWWT